MTNQVAASKAYCDSNNITNVDHAVASKLLIQLIIYLSRTELRITIPMVTRLLKVERKHFKKSDDELSPKKKTKIIR